MGLTIKAAQLVRDVSLEDNKYLGWLGLSSVVGVSDSNDWDQGIISDIIEAGQHLS